MVGSTSGEYRPSTRTNRRVPVPQYKSVLGDLGIYSRVLWAYRGSVTLARSIIRNTMGTEKARSAAAFSNPAT